MVVISHVRLFLRSCLRMQQAPSRLLKPLSVPKDRLLCGPGPSNAHPRVLEASALPMIGHLHPEFLEVMSDITAGLQYLFQTNNTMTIAVSGTGHAGLEASFVNLVEPGDRVLVLKNGIWGIRATDIAGRCGGEVYTLEHEPDEVFTLEEINEALKTHKPAVMFVCHGESSTGVVQPLEGIGELCQNHDCIMVVDTVASLGGVPFYMDKWNIDVVYSGSQKVIGAPPGTAPISFNTRARAKMASRKTKVRSFYFDMEWLAQYWRVDGKPPVYHHTGPISSYYALREGLAVIAEEGLEAGWKRHQTNAELLWDRLENLGLKMLTKRKDVRLPTINSVVVPDGVQWKEVVTYIMKKYNIEISGGLGPTAGRVWRIGLMGYNSTSENVDRVMGALEDALKQCNYMYTPKL